ncbi:hypothetical protein FVF75_09965 [Maritimibacter fusiformis]|uniref:Divergent polysaccharide deacetylase n=1 Tax=Maritimibacter fusiformis TaxID=2603819 RepID=A0A5D0RJ11_9RHOB|nr:hypothetical protein FVF75_09965 [Maritimibacter fusiformis]
MRGLSGKGGFLSKHSRYTCSEPSPGVKGRAGGNETGTEQAQGADLARGVLSGIVTGVVVAAVGLGIASLATGPVRAPLSEVPPEAEAVEAADLAAAGADTAPRTPPAPEVTQVPLDAPEMAAPADAETGEPVADPAPMPEAASDAPEAPVSPADDGGAPGGVAAGSTAPSAAEPARQTPPPSPEQPLAPEVPPAPVVADDDMAAADAMDDPAPGDAPKAAPQEETPEPAATETPDMAEAGTPDTAPDTGTAPPMVVVPAEPPKPAPRLPATPAPEPEPEPETPASDSAASVITGRLPSIGAAPPEIAALPGREPALTRNAIPFDAPSGQPMMAFLLLDQGPDRVGLGDLDKLPFPITVAVDAATPDAANALGYYRALGAETVLSVPLPEGATATDVAVTFEAYASLLERTVAAMVDEASGFQTLGAGAVQVAAGLAESGHGLVSFPQGLNTGHKAAIKEGVAAGLVFRDLDGEGQAPVVIRRFLDNAAFRARGERGVIVVARARPDTIQALLEWSLGNRAQTVTLAPLSAVLMAGSDG